ncbi:MAG TPA: DUF192 domain-containing protein [Candidatus Paceibacterota bacterium]
MKIRTALISSIVALAVIGVLGYFFIPRAETNKQAVFERGSQNEFVFEIADTDSERVQGLSGRKDISSDYGLLFVFPASGSYGFWMKDMHVSIDIAWLSEDGTVLKIEENVSPSTFPAVFYPPRAVRLVLETKAGEMRKQGWDVGTRVPLPKL